MTDKEAARRITARKYGGDDAQSWAVFLDGRVAYTGMGRSSVQYYRNLVRETVEQKEKTEK